MICYDNAQPSLFESADSSSNRGRYVAPVFSEGRIQHRGLEGDGGK
jgi:hypothetical protein